MTTYNLQACSEFSSIGDEADGKIICNVMCQTHNWQVTWRQSREKILTPTGPTCTGPTYLQIELFRAHRAIVERYRAQAKHVHAQLDEVLQRQLDENGPEIPELLITVAVPPVA